MRNPTPFPFLNDAPRELVEAADLGHCPGAGLCWPDDPLDTVIGYVSMLGDGFLEDLGLDDCSLPETRCAVVDVGSDDSSRKAPEDVKPNIAALAALAEADAPGGRALAALGEADAPGGPKRSACHVFDSAPERLSPPRPQAPSFTCRPTLSGRRSLSPTSAVPEPREHAPEEADLRWTVLVRKPHHRRVARSRPALPSWTLALPLALTAPAGGHDEDNANDEKDKDFDLTTYCNDAGGGGGGNGGLPRPGAGRKRQRKQASKDGKLKICSHCRADKTPQWRAGPAGNSTLCNACGIRYKMDKLFPEYRPSNSPEFSSNEHSNRHRNVERIRQRKKLKVMAPELPLTPDGDDKSLLGICKYENLASKTRALSLGH